ncbi:MAG: 3'-5' exonuclease, partial [Methylococcaceae bacterium]
LAEQAEAEKDSLALPALDAVKVMTHHGSKGLEWPVVILTGLENPVRDRLWSISTVSRSAVDVNQPLKDRFIRFWPWPFGKMEKVTIAEPIAQSDIAKEFHAAAVDEEKRLLYVSMTRARDLLVLARGGKETPESWIKTVEADWLLGDADAKTLTLPCGEKIPYQHLELEMPEGVADVDSKNEPIFWFKGTGGLASEQQRLPLKFNPSSAIQRSCKVVETVQIGNRIALKSGVDMAQLGTTIHGCIGAHFTDPNAPITEDEITQIMARMNVLDAVKAQELLGQVSAFSTWIKTRWPEAVPYAELPTEMRLPSGQVLQGRIDFLLKVSGGWILVDHKSNPGGRDRWDGIAQEYAGQLAAYRDSIEQASGQKVLENWLFLPISGDAIRLE